MPASLSALRPFTLAWRQPARPAGKTNVAPWYTLGRHRITRPGDRPGKRELLLPGWRPAVGVHRSRDATAARRQLSPAMLVRLWRTVWVSGSPWGRTRSQRARVSRSSVSASPTRPMAKQKVASWVRRARVSA